MKYLILLLLPFFALSQVKLPSPSDYFTPINTNPYNTPKPPNPMDMIFGKDENQRILKQNEQIMREVEQYEKQRIETLNQIKRDINEVDQTNSSVK